MRKVFGQHAKPGDISGAVAYFEWWIAWLLTYFTMMLYITGADAQVARVSAGTLIFFLGMIAMERFLEWWER